MCMLFPLILLLNKWCLENGSNTITISNDGTFSDFVSNGDGSEGTWALQGEEFKVYGFWVFEDNMDLPENYVDTFRLELLDQDTLILERAKNKDLQPEYNFNPDQIYKLKKCNSNISLTS